MDSDDWCSCLMHPVHNGNASFQVDCFGGAGVSGTKLGQDAIRLPSWDSAPVQIPSCYGYAFAYSDSVGSQFPFQIFAGGAGANPHANLSSFAIPSDTGSLSSPPGSFGWDDSVSTDISGDIFTPHIPVANMYGAAMQAEAFQTAFDQWPQLMNRPEPFHCDGSSLFGLQPGYRCSFPELMSTLPAPEPAQLHSQSPSPKPLSLGSKSSAGISLYSKTTDRVICICDRTKEFSSKSDWRRHVRETTGGPTCCGYCEKGFNRPANLHKHLGKHHPQELCWHCGELFPKPKPQAPPMRKWSGYECPVCKMRFSKQDCLNQHIEKKHRGGR